MMPLGEFEARVHGMIREINAAPLAKDAKRIHLPGEIELEKRELALAEGIVSPPDKEESSVADVYEKVYVAACPEVFFKSIGWRVVANRQPVRIRGDSRWNVPEPEMVLMLNRGDEIVGCCPGNDMSSRDIEGKKPLYLPQAKIYDGSCALGSGIALARPEEIRELPIKIELKEGFTLQAGDTMQIAVEVITLENSVG